LLDYSSGQLNCVRRLAARRFDHSTGEKTMAVKTEDDDDVALSPLEALVYCLMQQNEAYLNLFDTPASEVACRELGKSLRAVTKAISSFAQYYDSESALNYPTFEDDDSEQ
jgi:hypothetical protein